MSLYEIFRRLDDYIKLGVLFIILFFIGYFIYKKILNGTRKLNIKKALFYGISICYLVILIGAVFLDRGFGYNSINLHLFNSYIEAYHMMKMSLFRNIVLNILLFVPFGYLLPIYFKKLDKWYKVLAFGILTTIAIELIQYTTRIGIFELDDILNNNLGILIGYSYYKIFNVFKIKEDKKKILIYIIPTIIANMPFITMYIIYHNQELGNLESTYNYKINMKNVDVKSNVEYEDNIGKVNIYKIKKLKKINTRNTAKSIFNNLNTDINDERTIEYYEDTAFYYSKDNKYCISIEYEDGSFSLVNFDKFDKSEDQLDIVTILNYLNKLNIYIPNQYIYDEVNSKLIVNMLEDNNVLYDGYIKIDIEHNNINRIYNSLIKYDKVKEKEIISEKDAYQKILNGEFISYDNTKKILINDVKLIYVLDSKGFYVPVYEFNATADGYNLPIRISAIKRN